MTCFRSNSDISLKVYHACLVTYPSVNDVVISSRILIFFAICNKKKCFPSRRTGFDLHFAYSGSFSSAFKHVNNYWLSSFDICFGLHISSVCWIVCLFFFFLIQHFTWKSFETPRRVVYSLLRVRNRRSFQIVWWFSKIVVVEIVWSGVFVFATAHLRENVRTGKRHIE